MKDLTDKGRAAVIRIDASLTIYLSALNESFKSFLSSIRININQKIDPLVTSHISTRGKIGVILFFKKSAVSNIATLLEPKILAESNPNTVHEIDDLPEKEQEMSPITSEEENAETQSSDQVPKALQEALAGISTGSGDYSQILSNLKQAISSIKSPNDQSSNEINDLISVIRQQVEQESRAQQAPVVQNVNQFLSQQYPPRQPNAYMYPPNYMFQQPMYGAQYYQRHNQPYKPPSPKRDDPRRRY